MSWNINFARVIISQTSGKGSNKGENNEYNRKTRGPYCPQFSFYIVVGKY